MNNIFSMDEIPLGLGMALAKRNGGTQYFSSLDQAQRQEIINKSKTFQSKNELNSYVNEIMTAMGTTEF